MVKIEFLIVPKSLVELRLALRRCLALLGVFVRLVLLPALEDV